MTEQQTYSHQPNDVARWTVRVSRREWNAVRRLHGDSLHHGKRARRAAFYARQRALRRQQAKA